MNDTGRTMKRVSSLVLAATWLVFFTERPAYAYIDPAAGSLIIQVLLGGVAGVAVIVKMYWHRIASFFGRSDKPERSS